MCQLLHNTIPPHFEFLQFKPKNTLEQTHYLHNRNDVLPAQKLGFNQMSLKLVMAIPHAIFKMKVLLLYLHLLTPFHSNLYHLSSNKYKKHNENKNETLLQQNPLLNETDLYEDDNAVTKRIPHPQMQPTKIYVLLEIHLQFFSYLLLFPMI